MEKERRNVMVNYLKWTEINCTEVERARFRLEASVFNVEAKVAKNTITKCSSTKVPLWGKNGLIRNAFYPGRFKRIYVEKGYGHPMILPSQMLSIKPIATKFISNKTYNAIDNLDLRKGQLLLTRSGTIGNCTIVTKTLEGAIMSDDVIRITFNDYFDLGYIYAFLRTSIGQLILTTNNYGSVIQHIEPEHLEDIIVPKPTKELRISIHEKIIQSFDLRDRSNELLDRAEELLIKALKLPHIDKIKEENFKKDVQIKNFSVPLNFLDYRFDVSYHLPIINSIIDLLLDHADQVVTLGSEDISKNVILPGRFKRTYVSEENGTVFLGGKQIYELDPSNKKFLSKKHVGRIEKELFLHENMIVITCSGSIGRVNIIPKHWENWTMSQHILRIVPVTDNLAGYLYVWLNSDYGKVLIERYTYGSVVDEIDDEHIKHVPIPLLKDTKLMEMINNLALQANSLRSEAYYLEQEAIKQVNEEVIFN